MSLSTIVDVFRFGHQVQNPDTWKSVGTASPVIGLAIDNLLKVAEAHGYALHLTPELHDQLILAVAGVVLFIVHLISSRKAGILPAKPGGYGAGDGGAAVSSAVPAAPAPVAPAAPVPNPVNLGQAPIPGQPDLTA